MPCNSETRVVFCLLRAFLLGRLDGRLVLCCELTFLLILVLILEPRAELGNPRCRGIRYSISTIVSNRKKLHSWRYVLCLCDNRCLVLQLVCPLQRPCILPHLRGLWVPSNNRNGRSTLMCSMHINSPSQTNQLLDVCKNMVWRSVIIVASFAPSTGHVLC